MFLLYGCISVSNSPAKLDREKFDDIYLRMIHMENQDFETKNAIAINQIFSAWSAEQKNFWDLYANLTNLEGKKNAEKHLRELVKNNGSSYLLASPFGKRFFSDEEMFSISELGVKSAFWKLYSKDVGLYERFRIQRNNLAQ